MFAPLRLGIDFFHAFYLARDDVILYESGQCAPSMSLNSYYLSGYYTEGTYQNTFKLD